MATKLAQILAVEKGVKTDTDRDLTKHYHLLQKNALLSGFTRVHRKLNDEDPDVPGEAQKVQVNVEDVLTDITKILTRAFDVTAAKDYTNTKAKADIVVGGVTLAKDVPVTYLLFLEKYCENLKTVIQKLPTLDPAENWSRDETNGLWRSTTVTTARQKKIPRNHVLAEATDKHPAQVNLWHEDVIAGYWDVTRFSGALPATRVKELTEKITALIAAVKYAREAANSTNVEDPKPGKAILDWVFAVA